MRNLLVILSITFLAGCGVVQFQPMALYDTFEEPAAKEKIEQIIFNDAEGTMWNSLFGCGDFEVTKEEAYSGNSSIRLSWNKADCEWIGFGNSFSNWTGSDLSKDRFTQALSFYARTPKGSVNAIPIVACLEDFGGGGSYHFIDANKYLIGVQIDTTWKQILVPLWHFPVFEDLVDIRSIKQMQFQLEGAGSYFLDDIRIVDYSEEAYQAHREEVELMKPFGDSNQTIYTEGKLDEDSWGGGYNPCQTLEEIQEDENTCIKWEYDSDDCTWAKWGINWNDWYAANFRGLANVSVLRMNVKVIGDADFKVSLLDYQNHSSEFLNGDKIKSKGKWVEVRIPLKDLKLEEKNFKLDQIRELQFEGITSGTVFLDDIELVNYAEL